MKIIELYSPTCMPCKILDKRIQDIIKDHPEVEYNHLNALEHPEYNVQGTPHVIIIEDDGTEIYNQHVSNIVEVINFIKERL